jgi:hypothetical protein
LDQLLPINPARAVVIYSRLFKYTQHSAGFSENDWDPHLRRQVLAKPIVIKYGMDYSWLILTKCCYLGVDWSVKLTDNGGLSLNTKPYGRMNKSFFLETTIIIQPKLYMNGHWMVHYKVGIFMWIWYPRWPSPQPLVFNSFLTWPYWNMNTNVKAFS